MSSSPTTTLQIDADCSPLFHDSRSKNGLQLALPTSPDNATDDDHNNIDENEASMMSLPISSLQSFSDVGQPPLSASLPSLMHGKSPTPIRKRSNTLELAMPRRPSLDPQEQQQSESMIYPSSPNNTTNVVSAMESPKSTFMSPLSTPRKSISPFASPTTPSNQSKSSGLSLAPPLEEKKDEEKFNSPITPSRQLSLSTPFGECLSPASLPFSQSSNSIATPPKEISNETNTTTLPTESLKVSPVPPPRRTSRRISSINPDQEAEDRRIKRKNRRLSRMIALGASQEGNDNVTPTNQQPTANNDVSDQRLSASVSFRNSSSHQQQPPQVSRSVSMTESPVANRQRSTRDIEAEDRRIKRQSRRMQMGLPIRNSIQGIGYSIGGELDDSDNNNHENNINDLSNPRRLVSLPIAPTNPTGLSSSLPSRRFMSMAPIAEQCSSEQRMSVEHYKDFLQEQFDDLEALANDVNSTPPPQHSSNASNTFGLPRNETFEGNGLSIPPMNNTGMGRSNSLPLPQTPPRSETTAPRMSPNRRAISMCIQPGAVSVSQNGIRLQAKGSLTPPRNLNFSEPCAGSTTNQVPGIMVDTASSTSDQSTNDNDNIVPSLSNQLSTSRDESSAMEHDEESDAPTFVSSPRESKVIVFTSKCRVLMAIAIVLSVTVLVTVVMVFRKKSDRNAAQPVVDVSPTSSPVSISRDPVCGFDFMDSLLQYPEDDSRHKDITIIFQEQLDILGATTSITFGECDPYRLAITWLINTSDEYQLKNLIQTQELPSKLILASVYLALQGEGSRPWENEDNWLSQTVPECDWWGISCDSVGHVVEFNLQRNGIEGSIPDSLGLLKNIVKIDLGWNQIDGTIPLSLGNLNMLEYLNLAGNRLKGHLQSSLVAILRNLRVLSLRDNQLSGVLPNTLKGMQELEFFDVSRNNFEGSLSNIVESKNLVTLQLSDNKFTGIIPTSLYGFSNIEVLDFNNNFLTGSIPPEIGNATNLQIFRVAENIKFMSEIPIEIGNLQNLQELVLKGTNLVGTIPTELGDCTSLKTLLVSSVGLSGTIPTELTNLSDLRWLELSNIGLTGPVPKEIFTLENLQKINLRKNMLTGTGTLEFSDSIECADITSNQISAQLGESTCENPVLEDLFVTCDGRYRQDSDCECCKCYGQGSATSSVGASGACHYDAKRAEVRYPMPMFES